MHRKAPRRAAPFTRVQPSVHRHLAEDEHSAGYRARPPTLLLSLARLHTHPRSKTRRSSTRELPSAGIFTSGVPDWTWLNSQRLVCKVPPHRRKERQTSTKGALAMCGERHTPPLSGEPSSATNRSHHRVNQACLTPFLHPKNKRTRRIRISELSRVTCFPHSFSGVFPEIRAQSRTQIYSTAMCWLTPHPHSQDTQRPSRGGSRQRGPTTVFALASPG